MTTWPPVALLAVGSVVAQLWGLYLAAPAARPGGLPGADKVLHALGFALPVLLIPWADARRRRSAGWAPRPGLLPVVAALSGVHAVVSELVQAFLLPDRDGDPLDTLADGVGILLGGLAARAVLAHHRPAGAGRG